MPRKPRLFVPGCIYHVYARALPDLQLFRDDEDRNTFLDLLANGLSAWNIRCYAWVLMGNHYHLVLRAADQSLGNMFKPLGSRYVQYYNRKYKRYGTLFSDRFKSIATQDQSYVQELIRYVHLNPIRAGVCRNLTALRRYRWSGHRVLCGDGTCRFQQTTEVLRRFGKNAADARSAYLAYLREGIGSEESSAVIAALRVSNRQSVAGRTPACWVIGDARFVKKAISADAARRLRLARYAREGWDLEKLCGVVCRRLGINRKELLRRRWIDPVASGRKAFAWLACRELEILVSQTAYFLGVTPGAVSAMLRDGEKAAQRWGIVV